VKKNESLLPGRRYRGLPAENVVETQQTAGHEAVNDGVVAI
jgi:hypothetical protein